MTASKEAAPAPKPSTSMAAAADKSKDKGKGKEKSGEKSKGRKKIDASEEEDSEAFKKLCQDDVAMALSSRWIPLKKIRGIAAEHSVSSLP